MIVMLNSFGDYISRFNVDLVGQNITFFKTIPVSILMFLIIFMAITFAAYFPLIFLGIIINKRRGKRAAQQ